MEFHYNTDSTGVDTNVAEGEETITDTQISKVVDSSATTTTSPHHQQEYFRNSSSSTTSSLSADVGDNHQATLSPSNTRSTLSEDLSNHHYHHQTSQSVKNFDSLSLNDYDDYVVITRMRSSTVCTSLPSKSTIAESLNTTESAADLVGNGTNNNSNSKYAQKSELQATTAPTAAVTQSSLSAVATKQQQSMKNVKRAQATREYKQNLELVFDGTKLFENNEEKNTLDPKSVIFIDHFEYALIPDDVEYSDPLFLSQVERLKQIIEKEYNESGVISQCKRDAILWRRTLENPEYDSLGNILRRVFCVLRYGGLMYRQDAKVEDWKLWNTTRYPIASVLSHGSRVIIQLDSMDRKTHGEDEHSFWKWLVTGTVDGDLSKIISTKTSGNEARIDGKVIFRRLGATHALDYYKPQASDQLILDKPIELEITNDEELPTNMIDKFLENESQSNGHYRQRRVMRDVSKMMEEPPIQLPKKIIDDKYNFSLPMGKKKVLHETKTIGITFRDTKLFGTTDGFLKHHRHWGMNLPLGGAENRSLTGKKIEANGEHGHMYIYYQSPKKGRFGGLLIGVEGSEYSKYDQSGGYHSLSAKSPHFSPTFGYKWRGKDGHNDLNGVAGPDKYNSLLVDLTGGWKFLIEKYENDWKDDFVSLTSLTP